MHLLLWAVEAYSCRVWPLKKNLSSNFCVWFTHVLCLSYPESKWSFEQIFNEVTAVFPNLGGKQWGYKFLDKSNLPILFCLSWDCGIWEVCPKTDCDEVEMQWNSSELGRQERRSLLPFYTFLPEKDNWDDPLELEGKKEGMTDEMPLTGSSVHSRPWVEVEQTRWPGSSGAMALTKVVRWLAVSNINTHTHMYIHTTLIKQIPASSESEWKELLSLRIDSIPLDGSIHKPGFKFSLLIFLHFLCIRAWLCLWMCVCMCVNVCMCVCAGVLLFSMSLSVLLEHQQVWRGWGCHQSSVGEDWSNNSMNPLEYLDLAPFLS